MWPAREQPNGPIVVLDWVFDAVEPTHRYVFVNTCSGPPYLWVVMAANNLAQGLGPLTQPRALGLWAGPVHIDTQVSENNSVAKLDRTARWASETYLTFCEETKTRTNHDM